MPNTKKPTLVVSTCGTSLLTNKSTDEIRGLLNRSANMQEQDFSISDRTKILDWLSQKRKLLFDSSLQDIRRMSAELNGLIGFYDGQLASGKSDIHILLHTDTWLGKIIAELIRDWLASQSLSAQLETFPELCTKDISMFQHGMSDLIAWCGNTLPGYRQQQYNIIFNLVGGFKSIQGFLQTIGMIYADEILYIFESSDELLRIPRLPIDVDRAAFDHIRQHINTFRQLDPSKSFLPYSQCQNLMELFLYRLEEEAELSPWGRLIWGNCKPKLYQEGLLDSPSATIVYSKKFKDSANKLQFLHFAQLNQRIDDFWAYLQNGSNPKRLDFKPLKSNPKPPSTHEMDAWADKGAWRIFLHEEDGQWILDDLGPGLH